MNNNKYKIGLFDGDMRLVYLGKFFIDYNYKIASYNLALPINNSNCDILSSYEELFETSNIIVGPVPFPDNKKDMIVSLLKKDHLLIAGLIPSCIKEHCKKNQIRYIDIMENENIAILNAIATAEGTIMEAIKSSKINLHSSKCLVLGFGKCAKVLAIKLKGLDAHVDIAARSQNALSYAFSLGYNSVNILDLFKHLYKYDFIFNTIPSMVLDKYALDMINKNCTIIDIASKPGGVDFIYADKIGLNAKLCLSLPGKVSPKTSAQIIGEEILTFF